jgi:putative tryptophan/tyrosine transport system substrate-binding protein
LPVPAPAMIRSGLPKRTELMRELLPSVSTMALLVNPTTPALAEPSMRISQAAARALGLELHVLQARSEHDFDPTFAKLENCAHAH